MSGTRSHFLKAQATDALIVAHGQPSDPEPAEEALAALTARVQRHLPELRLGSASLAHGGAFETALEALRPDGLVYPLFMANGWFVRTALRRRIGDTPCRVLPPLGLDADLPAVAMDVIEQALEAEKLQPEDTQILLAAHGSARGKAAAEAAHDFAIALNRLNPNLAISTGFVEQAPFLPDLAPEIKAPCLCLPFFAMEGGHMKEDIREGLADAHFPGQILPALGMSDGIAALIASALRDENTQREAA